jgi:hypothetical protein
MFNFFLHVLRTTELLTPPLNFPQVSSPTKIQRKAKSVKGNYLNKQSNNETN